MEQRKRQVIERFFSLCVCSGDVSKKEGFELLCFACTDVHSLEDLSGVIFNEPRYLDSEDENAGK